MADSGWKNEDGKMQTTKCRWKNADDKNSADEKLGMTTCGWWNPYDRKWTYGVFLQFY